MDISMFFYKANPVKDDESCYLKIFPYGPGEIQIDCWGHGGPDLDPDWSCVLRDYQITELIDALVLMKKSTTTD